MRIIADPNIPQVAEAVAALGLHPPAACVLVPGRAWTPALMRDADALLVRSVTRVDAALLAGSRVRFVGTATAGLDHLDLAYLQAHGIAWADAAGANARSVAEYCLAAALLLWQGQGQGREIAGATVGIVGCGHVGTLVGELFTALGARCIRNDPPLAALQPGADFRPLTEALAADLVTLHCPLTCTGPHPTVGLLSAREIAQLRPGALLINAARGGVVIEPALRARLEHGPPLAVVLDCWAGEPCIDPDLLAATQIATPHIAGYSHDGKLRGTGLLYAALCRHLGVPPTWHPAPPPEAPPALVPEALGGGEAGLARAVAACYDIAADSAVLKATLALPAAARAARFDALRRDYPIRREFAAYPLLPPPPDNPLALELARLLAAAGFAAAAPSS
jgi:erythronate-4-phosphate dehydrogenase